MTVRGVPGPSRRLSEEQILDTALDLLVEEGEGALTVRRLAGRLGVSHMALYRYYASKDELLHAAAGHALPDPDAESDPAAPWDERLRELVLRIHEAVASRPGVAQLMALYSGSGPRVDSIRERIIALLLEGGLPPGEALGVLGVITRFVAGAAIVETGTRRASDAAEVARLSALPADRFPVLASLADHYLEHESAAVVGLGVDLLIDSLRRKVAAIP